MSLVAKATEAGRASPASTGSKSSSGSGSVADTAKKAEKVVRLSLGDVTVVTTAEYLAELGISELTLVVGPKR